VPAFAATGSPAHSVQVSSDAELLSCIRMRYASHRLCMRLQKRYRAVSTTTVPPSVALTLNYTRFESRAERTRLMPQKDTMAKDIDDSASDKMPHGIPCRVRREDTITRVA
jgi:hypothetical protein